MRCDRCLSVVSDEKFCWMCGLDLAKDFIVCPRCGDDVGNDGQCWSCGMIVLEQDDDITSEEE